MNITPDSFSGDGLFKKENKLSKLLDFAERNNISNLDIGCASSKPGYEKYSEMRAPMTFGNRLYIRNKCF